MTNTRLWCKKNASSTATYEVLHSLTKVNRPLDRDCNVRLVVIVSLYRRVTWYLRGMKS